MKEFLKKNIYILIIIILIIIIIIACRPLAFKENNEYLLSDSCIVDNVNFISSKHPAFCTAKFRYRGPDYGVSLEYLDNEEILVRYPEKVSAVTPGQACVFYLGTECLGSGIIKEVRKDNKKLWYL